MAKHPNAGWFPRIPLTEACVIGYLDNQIRQMREDLKRPVVSEIPTYKAALMGELKAYMHMRHVLVASSMPERDEEFRLPVIGG